MFHTFRGEWNIIRDRAYAKGPDKINGMSVFGKYLAKMKLKQWKDKRWADSEVLTAEAEQKRNAEMQILEERSLALEKDYEEGNITESEYKTMTSVISQNQRELENKISNAKPSYLQEEDEDEINIAASLTEEDKIYLAMKWGKTYKAHEWVELEKIYTEMMASFDIQDADTINTLILICKTNLKMNQAIDIGDLDGFQKLSRVFESLRKSAKFTAAQNKDASADTFDSVGILVDMCEKEGFIPRYATGISQDKVDFTLKDMNNYLNKLVTQDLGFGQQIENALKKIQLQKELQNQEENEKDIEEVIELEDEDYEAFYEDIAHQKELDSKLGDE